MAAGAGRGRLVVFEGAEGVGKSTTSAVVLMTRSVATGHAMQGIRANTVCPGQIETPMLRGVFEQLGDRAAGVEAMFRAKNPSARFGEVHEVTAAVLFLLSDAASYINGAALPIDGGRLA